MVTRVLTRERGKIVIGKEKSVPDGNSSETDKTVKKIQPNISYLRRHFKNSIRVPQHTGIDEGKIQICRKTHTHGTKQVGHTTTPCGSTKDQKLLILGILIRRYS